MSDKLREAAKAVCDRWDSPDWSDGMHTKEYIDRLRAALSEEPERELTETVNDQLIAWSKEGYTPQLVYDDNGHWAVAMDSFGGVRCDTIAILDDGLLWDDTPLLAVEAKMRGNL